MTASTEVDTVTGEIVQPGSALQEMIDYVATLEPEDDDAVQERILRSILSATTREDLANAGGTVSTEDLLNVELRCHAIHPAESTFEDGPGFFLHVDVETIANGDRVTLSTGAQDIVAKLVTASKRGWLPFDFTLYRSENRTKAGYYPIFMRTVEPPF